MKTRPGTPLGNGEVIAEPHVDAWGDMAAATRTAAHTWQFAVGGMPAADLRRQARSDAMHVADELAARIGLGTSGDWDDGRTLIVTGHQPDLYHTGIWAKPLLAERAAEALGGVALDVAVDSDGFDTVGVVVPCIVPTILRCHHYLAVGTAGGSFAGTSIPSDEDIATFCASVHSSIDTLAAPAVGRHFAEFCEALEASRVFATDLAELVVFARRFHERPAGAPYSQAMMTTVARTPSFRRFVVDLATRASEVRDTYNTVLGEYRDEYGIRTAAQPFPDLGVVGGGVELPLWFVSGGRRKAVGVIENDAGALLMLADGPLIQLPQDVDAAIAALGTLDGVIAPRAATLTLFLRVFVADVFIHGIGGARYDRVTDVFAERFYGITPPPFATVSMTLYLPLGMHVVADDELDAARQRAHRLKHNPDQLIDEVDFDTPEQGVRAHELAGRKAELVAAIALPGADRKDLGLKIRVVNEALAEMLAPISRALEEQVRRLEAERASADVLTDRTYPFCLFSALDVVDRLG